MPVWGWLTIALLAACLVFALVVIFWLLHCDPYRDRNR